MSLLARYLESNGLPTVIMGSAKDIVEHCAVPRFFFVDFPLGNPCGIPWDRPMQDRLVAQALGLFESATQAQTTVAAGVAWPGDQWKANYMAVTEENRAELAAKGEALRERRKARQPRTLD